jgi:hypothetical protein
MMESPNNNFCDEGAKPPTPLFASKYAATPDAGTAPRNAPPGFYLEIPYVNKPMSYLIRDVSKICFFMSQG